MEKNDKDKRTNVNKDVYTVEAIPIGTRTVKELLKELLTQIAKDIRC